MMRRHTSTATECAPAVLVGLPALGSLLTGAGLTRCKYPGEPWHGNENRQLCTTNGPAKWLSCASFLKDFRRFK